MLGRDSGPGPRPAAVAGSFYPRDPDQLRAQVDALLADADERLQRMPLTFELCSLRALIAPHAGYVYSGSTAAMAYALVRLAVEDGLAVERVILLGPTHRVPWRGLAHPGVEAFATPLGTVRLPHTPEVADLVPVAPHVHADEHSLEVHLPFLQRALPGVPVLPLAVGHAPATEVAEVLDLLWTPRSLVVASSDLSHYLPYDEARAVDAVTLDAWVHLLPVPPEHACGAYAVNGLLLAAAERLLDVTVLAACSSGDTAGDRERVVGYATLALTG